MDNEFERQDPVPQEHKEPAADAVVPQQPASEPVVTPVSEQPQAPAMDSYIPERPVQQPQYSAPQQPTQPMPHYEPTASSEYRWVRPDVQAQYTSPNPPRVKMVTKPKKSGVFKKVIAVLLVILLAMSCALMGGIFGAKYVEYRLNQDDGDSLIQKDPSQNDDTNDKTGGNSDGQVNVQEGHRESTVIDVEKIDTSKIMTAAEVYALNVNSTVGITTSITTNYWGYTTTSAASGSGFIYSADGYIITNFHVIEDSNSISVSLYDGRSLDAELVGYDESNDVAVLKVEAEDLTPVVIGDSDNLNVGDPVVAIGNPLGELTFSLTSGAVSALDREVTFSGGITMNLIQTDCAINSGNSGGALFNLYGEVIGITNAKYSGNSSSGATIDNIGFAIPMNHVRSIVDSIIENGYVVKPYIGVSVTDVSAESQGYGLPKGASVQNVEDGSPADDGGLRQNDIITHVNGVEITGASDLKQTVTESVPGDVLKLTVWRRNEIIELSITVGEQIQTSYSQEMEQNNNQQPGYPYYGWGY